MEYLLIILFSLLFSYILLDLIAARMGLNVQNQGLRLVINKTIFYILLIYIIFMSLKSLYGIYQYNTIYSGFKKTEITQNVNISTLKDSYILLEGKITSKPTILENEYIESTNSFVYLEENKEHYTAKTGWETDNTSKFYANNVCVCNVPIDLKTFTINNSEEIKETDIKESYKKYYDQNLYFNKSDGSRDKRFTYKVLRNNDDVLIFSKVIDGNLVSISNINNSIIFAGEDNYKRLDSYLKANSNQNITSLMFIGFSALILVLYNFKKDKLFSKLY
jgi:hypothetical protein